MKIAIASDDKVTISNHFGRCRGFLIFQIDNSKIINKLYRDNNCSRHGHKTINEKSEDDFHKALVESLNDCTIVISQGMGQRIYNDFQKVGIMPFIVDQNNPENAVDLYLNNNLKNSNDGCVGKQ